jgi:transcriptional regulator with XRE-family HTH domain
MARRRFFEDTESLGLASRYLREAAGLTLQQVVDGIERQSGVKIGPKDLHSFETGSPTIGQERITALVAFHGCATPQEMIEKGNATARQHQVYDSEMLCLASRYLREAAGLTQQQVVDGIERQLGVKIALSQFQEFERGTPKTLGRKKIDALIAFHGCATPQEMIEKGNAIAQHHQVKTFDTKTLGSSARILREAADLSLAKTVEGIERQSGVRISRQALHQFETGIPSIKIDTLIAFHGCATPQEMIDKANYVDEFKNKPAGEALAHTLRRILDRPFHRLEKLAATRNESESSGRPSR